MTGLDFAAQRQSALVSVVRSMIVGVPDDHSADADTQANHTTT